MIEANQVIGWAKEGGEIALRYFNQIETIHYKADDSFVTQADLEIEKLLAAKIRAAFPDDGLVGEEGNRSQTDQERLWAIDPIDGTTSFVQGIPGWGSCIGLLDKGRPVFGLFYMPLLDDATYTEGSEGVYCNRRDIRGAVRTGWENKGFLAVTARSHHNFEIKVRYTRTMGSAGSGLIYTARGSATAAFVPEAHLWDLVAGAAIINRAGGELRYLSGRPIDYLELLDGRLAPEPIIAGHPRILDELAPRIQPRNKG